MKLFKRKPKLTPRENAERLYKEGMRSVQTETREDEMTQKVEPEEPIEESIVDVPPLEYKRESKLKEIKIWDATAEVCGDFIGLVGVRNGFWINLHFIGENAIRLREEFGENFERAPKELFPELDLEELREYCAKRGIDYIHHSWPVDYGD